MKLPAPASPPEGSQTLGALGNGAFCPCPALRVHRGTPCPTCHTWIRAQGTLVLPVDGTTSCLGVESGNQARVSPGGAIGNSCPRGWRRPTERGSPRPGGFRTWGQVAGTGSEKGLQWAVHPQSGSRAGPSVPHPDDEAQLSLLLLLLQKTSRVSPANPQAAGSGPAGPDGDREGRAGRRH